MIDFTGIAQNENLKHLTGAKLVKALRNLEDNKEVKEVILSLVPTYTQQETQIVEPNFINYIMNLDSIDTAEKILGIKRHSPEADSDECLAMSMFVSAIKHAFLSVINELSADFSAENCSWEDYISCIESLGFSEISRIEYTPKYSQNREESISFFNYEYSMLWVINSYSFNIKKVSGSTLYLSGKLRNREESLPDFSFSIGNITPTDIFNFSFQMNDLPIFRFFEILTHINPVERWGVFDLFDSRTLEQIKSFPKEVKNKILDCNIMSYNQEDINQERNAVVINETMNIFTNLMEEQQIYLNLFVRAQKFSDRNSIFLPKFLEEQFKIYNDDEVIYKYMIASTTYHSKLFDKMVQKFIGDRSLQRAIIETLKSEDLVDYYDTFKNMDSRFQDLYFTEEDKDLFFEKMNS